MLNLWIPHGWSTRPPRLASRPRGDGVGSNLSRDQPDLEIALREARWKWLAGHFSHLVAGIARELRTWRDARTLKLQERPQDSDILPNPWLSY